MTREEAIEVIKAKADYLESDKRFRAAVETIIPELAESEDERIRRKMIEHFKAKTKETWCNMPVKDIVTYLEKQKENPKTADSIPSNCMSYAKCDDRDSEYVVFPEDALVVARACQKLEAHGYQELAYALINVNLYTKEQKPAVDKAFEEWSEEDKKMLSDIIVFVSGYADKRVVAEWVTFLKSIRPSWKPSDEQLRPLEYAIDYFKKKRNDTTYLESLYNDLKKL